VSVSDNKRYRFADVLIDKDQRLVVVEGQEVEIQPRVFDLLIYLIQKRDRAVSKQELQDQIWPGMLVSETVLSRAVMKARKAVGDDAQNQSIIKTLHGHGYRFIAELEDIEPEHLELAGPAVPHQESAEPGKRISYLKTSRAWAPLLLVVLLVIGYLIIPGFFNRTPEADPTPSDGISIAVLPFANLSDDKRSEYS